MKKYISVILVCLICLTLASCKKTYKGIDKLSEKAKEELPVSYGESFDMRYAGMCTVDDKALAWFIFGNEYQSRYYLPMEVKIIGEEEYSYVCTYKPIDDRTEDIALLYWENGYAFIVNNQKCSSVKIIDENITHEEKIEKETYPYVFYYHPLTLPKTIEYVFLDFYGNELR